MDFFEGGNTDETDGANLRGFVLCKLYIYLSNLIRVHQLNLSRSVFQTRENADDAVPQGYITKLAEFADLFCARCILLFIEFNPRIPLKDILF
jgi:hypothetical protein